VDGPKRDFSSETLCRETIAGQVGNLLQADTAENPGSRKQDIAGVQKSIRRLRNNIHFISNQSLQFRFRNRKLRKAAIRAN